MPEHGPRIHLTISSHGYGHLTQSIALARELIKQTPDTMFRIQCNHSKQIIAERLGTNDFEHEMCSMDIGLIQTDPITPDLHASYQAYDALHENFSERVHSEAKNISHWHPDIVISDIPYLPLAAAAKAGVPCISLASLSWDSIIEAYFDLNDSAPKKWHEEAQAAYGETTLALLPTPAMEGSCFPNKKYIPPIAILGQRQSAFRSVLNIQDMDDRPVIFCSLGGIPGAKLPISLMKKETCFHWLINGPEFPASENIHHLSGCKNWHYRDVIASVDGLIGKPGYGMAVEVAAHGLPFVFFRRGHFPDEPVIVDWLHQQTRAKEITGEDWAAGAFVEPLTRLFDSPAPKPPLCNGAEVGALEIDKLLHSLFK